MNQREREQYVAYRLETARSAYHAACVLADNKLWLSAINRFYYAAFYAVNALLVYQNIQTLTHAGVKTEFSRIFIKTGIVDISHGQLFSELFDLRQKGDYGSVVQFEPETVLSYLEPVKDFIDALEAVIIASKPD